MKTEKLSDFKWAPELRVDNAKLEAENAKLQTDLQALAEAAQAVVDADKVGTGNWSTHYGNLRDVFNAIDRLSEALEQ